MGKKIPVDFEGKTYESFNELVRQVGVVEPDRVRAREKAGWDRKEALLTPPIPKTAPQIDSKTKADYHRLASDRGWKWIGKSLPQNVNEPTKWECNKGHERTMTYTSVRVRNECWNCRDERIKHPDHLDPRAHSEDDYYRLAARQGLKYLGPYPRNSKKHTNWQCAKGHKPWPVSYNSIDQGHGCPSCSGLRADFDNNLEVLFPEIAKQWHPTKNGNKKPSEVTAGTNKTVWWHCPNSKLPRYPHDFLAMVKERTRSDKPSGCPHCSTNHFDPTIEAWLYYLRVDDYVFGTLYKIGITNN